MTRRGGVLLHISSLPGPLGVGDMGPSAELFADFLADSGFSVWQMLPLNPVNAVFGDSPYSSPSVFAGNKCFISSDRLRSEGLVGEDDITPLLHTTASKADYSRAASSIDALLSKAFAAMNSDAEKFAALRSDFAGFCERESAWLDDYALYSALKKRFHEACWNDWPDEYRRRDVGAMERFARSPENAVGIELTKFTQFIFYRQWNELHEYCRARGVSIMGDLPMFAAFDSADVWAGQSMFDLDPDGRPNCVAGVPPDYFSATGQRWGNPLYRWERMEAGGFGWWRGRIAAALKMFDMARIDHFRGFCGYWAIPADDETAVGGRWKTAPGRALFRALSEDLKLESRDSPPLVAEDLGVITDDVRELMNEFGLPGMKVLLFAFGCGVGANPYAPHNIARNSIVYTGTHDNNTILGWWETEASADDRLRFKDYVGHDVEAKDAPKAMLALAFASVADTAIAPMQDILGLGAECRMNTPGRRDGNWGWRLAPDDFAGFAAKGSALSERLRRMNVIYGRHV